MSSISTSARADRRKARLWRALMLSVALLYVAVLLLAPLGGIIYYALKEGLGEVGHTYRQSDVRHAFYLTAIIMVVTVIVTTFFGIIVALVWRATGSSASAWCRPWSTCRWPSRR